MTKQEKIIVSAYTGVLMCDFADLHEYIQKKFGRPVYTHELADGDIQEEVKEKSKEDFMKICNREEPERKTGKWIIDYLCSTSGGTYQVLRCSICKHLEQPWQLGLNFCPNCGTRMKGEDNA